MADWRKIRRGAAITGIAAGGVVVSQLALIGARILKEAWSYPPAIDTGRDPRLSAPPFPVRSSMVPAHDGTLLHVQTSGDIGAADEVIVLIHGWTCNASFWNPQVRHLGPDRAIVAYDQRGHGLSELGHQPIHVDLLGQDLEAVLEAVVPEGKRALLVGHSMGGMTIMNWSAQYWESSSYRVEAVVLVSCAARRVVQRQELVPRDLPKFTVPFVPLVARLFTSLPVPLPSNDFTGKLTHYIALAPYATRAHIEFCDELISACPTVARAKWGAAMYHLNVLDELVDIQVPAVVVVGTQDRLTPVRHSDEFASVLEQCGKLWHYVRFDQTGHMVPFERATEFNRLLDDVLARTATARSGRIPALDAT